MLCSRFLQTAVFQNGLALEYAIPILRRAVEFAKAPRFRPAALQLPEDERARLVEEMELEERRQEENLVRAAVSQNGLALQFAPPRFTGDIDMVRMAVLQNGMALQFAAPELRDTFEIVQDAVKNNGLALQFAGPTMSYVVEEQDEDKPLNPNWLL